MTMRMSPTRINHTDAILCPGCEDHRRKLHPVLSLCIEELRRHHPDAHIVMGFLSLRDEPACDCKSVAHFRTFSDKTPCSEGVDLFRFCGDGEIHYERSWYETVYARIIKEKLPISWPAGEGKDSNYEHFELLTGLN